MTRIMDAIDTPAATDDPESNFDSPSALAEHIGLTRGQRLAALERWTFSVRARVDAVSEGMNSHSEGNYTQDVELLRDLEKLIEHLSHENGQSARDEKSQ